MNEKQRRVLIAAGAVVLVMLIYPPFHIRWGRGNARGAGYSFLWDVPVFGASVDAALLAMQWAAVLIVAGIAFFVLKDKP